MKVARANQHIQALNREVRLFMEEKANKQIISCRCDEIWHIVSINPVIENSMPLLCSVICGDVVHNLRSASDHLVWQLVLAQGNTPDRWNSFPIYTDPNQFQRKVKYPSNPEQSPLHGVAPSEELWRLIEGEQPYNSQEPSEHHLNILAKPSNVDKHRTLHTSWFYAAEDSIRAAVGWNSDASLLDHQVNSGPLPPNSCTDILRLRFSAIGSEPRVSTTGGISLQPTFGDGETLQFTLGGITQMPVWTKDFVEKFAHCF